MKRFQVSDKFAGKAGPCPNCKKQLKVPDKSEEVVIHAPEDDAPKDRAGQSILKPLERTETEVTRKGMLITGGAILAAIAVAIGLRVAQFFQVPEGDSNSGAQILTQMLGALLLAPPLVWAGYTFVRDSELAPYVGPELRNRVLILSGIFSALWILYAFVPSYLTDEPTSQMSFLAFGIIFAIMLVIGAFASVGTFELEFTSGLAHAGLYLIATMALALLSGITLATG